MTWSPVPGGANHLYLELDDEALQHFQRFILVLVAGYGGDVVHLDHAGHQALLGSMRQR